MTISCFSAIDLSRAKACALHALALLAVILVSLPASGADVPRWVLKAGMGWGHVAFDQRLDYAGMEKISDDNGKFAFNMNARLSASIKQLPQTFASVNCSASWFSIQNATGSEVTILSGLISGGLEYRFFRKPLSPYVFFGIGEEVWGAPFEGDSDIWSGLGYIASVGYEFRPHWGIEGSVRWGNTDREAGYINAETDVFIVHFTINYLLYR